MTATSSSALVLALEPSPRRSRTATVAGPSSYNPSAPLEHLDPNNDNGPGAIEAQSRALEKEKATLTWRIELWRLQQEVEDLQAADASQRQQASVPLPLQVNPNDSDDPSSIDGTRC